VQVQIQHLLYSILLPCYVASVNKISAACNCTSILILEKLECFGMLPSILSQKSCSTYHFSDNCVDSSQLWPGSLFGVAVRIHGLGIHGVWLSESSSRLVSRNVSKRANFGVSAFHHFMSRNQCCCLAVWIRVLNRIRCSYFEYSPGRVLRDASTAQHPDSENLLSLPFL